MTKKTQNFFPYVYMEFDTGPTEANKAWVENHFGMSIHINDRVVAINHNDVMWSGRVLRRSKVLPKNVAPLRIRYTANQFPVADHPVQPELPVVPHATRLHELTKQLEDAIIQIRTLI